MPSRRKAKHAKKLRISTTPNHHSSPTIQFLGKCDLEENRSLRPVGHRYPYAVVEEEKTKKRGHSLSAGEAAPANHSKMEGSFNGTLGETQKTESPSEDKEVIIEEIDSSFHLDGEVAADEKSRSLTETQENGDSIITDEQGKLSEENTKLVDSGKVEERDVSESVVNSIDAMKAPVDNLLASDTVESEMKEKQEKDFLSPFVANDGVKGLEDAELPPSEENNELSSVSGYEGLRDKTDVVETIKDLTGADEIKLPPVVTDELLGESEETNEKTDVASKETLEATIPKADESEEVPPTTTEAVPKGIKKLGEPSNVEEQSKESASESLQPLPNVPAAETTRATVQDKTAIPRNTENPTTVSVIQPPYTSWSCCGLFEFLKRGDDR